MRIKTKLIIITFVILILIIGYKIYRYEIFVWSCEQEEIASSCMLAGKIMEEKNSFVSAERHYKESCSRDYGIGCHALAELYHKQGRSEEADKYYRLSCKLDSICKSQKSSKDPVVHD